ncbi:MAG: cation:proton antiporter [archaeon]
MELVFIQIAIILFMAFVVSYIVRAFRQPILIGYIITGIIIAFIIESGAIDLGAAEGIIDLFSQFGIAFLLFIVGLHLNPRVIKEIGTPSLVIGLGQIILTFILGFLLSISVLGFDTIPSIYIAIALTFSSTIILMKLLSDQRQLDSLFGKISIGILIIQDLVAISVLMFISSLSGDIGSSSLQKIISGGGIIVFLFLIGFFVLPRITKNIARSQELLFLFSICWCFIIAALFSLLDLGIEIGALIAGVVLSLSPYSTEISSKIRPLRDFFLIIFFIILGLKIPISNLSSIITHALILSLFVLIVKPIILMGLMAFSGYTKRTNFQVGTSLAQISEFSLIVLLAASAVLPSSTITEIIPTLALTLVITIIFSSYFIIYSQGFYNKMSRIISIFERRKLKKQKKVRKNYDAILFGYNRIGFNILQSLKKIKKDYLIVDFNPDTIDDLTKLRIPCLYGDVYDPDFIEELPLEKLKLAVSTIPDFETNFLLIESIRLVNPNAIIILRAHQIEEALDLYKKGANYVLTPHFLGGEYISKMIKELGLHEKDYEEEKMKHIENLKRMRAKGHEHPEVERN